MPVKETLQAFVDVLRREQDALASGEIEALAPLTSADAERFDRVYDLIDGRAVAR